MFLVTVHIGLEKYSVKLLMKNTGILVVFLATVFLSTKSIWAKLIYLDSLSPLSVLACRAVLSLPFFILPMFRFDWQCVNKKQVLKDINFEFEKGKIYGIVGKNGSGKSMFFKAICGLINKTSGSIKVLDNSIENGYFAKDVGIIIESPGFLPQYSAFNNLKILASINNKINDNDIINAISLVGLNPYDKKEVKKYSLGMKQKLGIAQAIMESPKILILDEPMNGLDHESINQIRKLLLEQKNNGVTILLASHNKDDITVLCDKIYNMNSGILTEIK